MARHINTLWHDKTKHLSKEIRHGNMLSDPKREKLWTRDFIIISFVNLLMAGGFNMLMATFPLYMVELGGTETTVGLAAALYSVMALLMRPLAGRLLDTHSRRTIFFIGIIGVIIIMPLYGMLPFIGIAIVLRGLHGFFGAAGSTSSNTNACDTLPASRFGEGMGFFGLTNSLATVIGPALGLVLWQTLGGVYMFFIISGLAALALLLLRRFNFKTIERVRQAGNMPFTARLANLFDKRALPASSLLFAIFLPGGAVYAFIALYAVSTGVGNAGLYFTWQAIGTCATRVFSGKISDVKGEGPAIYAGCICFALGLVMLIMAQGSFIFYLGAFFYGMGYGVQLPALQSMSVRNVPPQRRGAASSTYLCSFDVSYGLGGMLGGVLAELVGFRAMFSLLGVGIIACALIYRFWASKTPAAYNYQAAQQQQE